MNSTFLRLNFKNCKLLTAVIIFLWIFIVKKLEFKLELWNINSIGNCASSRSDKNIIALKTSQYNTNCKIKPFFYTEIGSQAKNHPDKLKHVIENLEYKYNMYRVKNPADATIIWTWPTPFDMKHVLNVLNERHYLNHIPGMSPFIIKEAFVINFKRDYIPKAFDKISTNVRSYRVVRENSALCMILGSFYRGCF